MVFRFLEKNKPNHLFLSFSGGAGWMVQKNAPIQLLQLRPRIEMHANSLSGDIAVGYSFRLAKHVSVRLKASCTIGYPNSVTIPDKHYIPKPDNAPFVIGDYCQNMNTINLTAGFSFHK
jgi:hypothetical protein